MQNEDTARLLDDLEDRVLALGDRVESMLIRSAGLLQRPDSKGIMRLKEEEQHVRQMRRAIEKRGLALIGAHEPGNGGERSPVVLMEIASDLEMISDHAGQIGRVDYVVLDRGFGNSLQRIDHLVDVVRRLLHQAVWAAAQRDQVAAQAVLARAAETSPLYETLQQELRALMRRRHRFASQAVHLAHAVNQLGLATEKVVSICERVRFESRGGTDATSNV